MESLLGQFWEVWVVGIGLYVMRKIIGDWLVDNLRRSDRRMAIWDHYTKGTHSGEVTTCNQDKCATL